MAQLLSPEKTQSYAQRLIIAGIREGLSGNAIQKNLQSVGLGYNRQQMLSDISRYRKTDPNLPRVSLPAFKQYLSDNFYYQIPTTGGTRYKTAFTMDAINKDTGKTVRQVPFSIISQYKLIPDIALSQALDGIDWAASNLTPLPDSAEMMQPQKFVSELP